MTTPATVTESIGLIAFALLSWFLLPIAISYFISFFDISL